MNLIYLLKTIVNSYEKNIDICRYKQKIINWRDEF